MDSKQQKGLTCHLNWMYEYIGCKDLEHRPTYPVFFNTKSETNNLFRPLLHNPYSRLSLFW